MNGYSIYQIGLWKFGLHQLRLLWEASMAEQLFHMQYLWDMLGNIPNIICHLHRMDTNICSITYRNFSPKTELPRFPFPCWVNLKIHVTWGSKYLSTSKSRVRNWCRAEEKDNLKAQFHSLVAQSFVILTSCASFGEGAFSTVSGCGYKRLLLIAHKQQVPWL